MLTQVLVGTVRPLAGIKVGYLPQEPELDEAKTVRENVFDGVSDKKAAVDRFKEINDMISQGTTLTPELQLEHARLKARVETENLMDLDRKIDVAMVALRCPPGDSEVDMLSGVR